MEKYHIRRIIRVSLSKHKGMEQQIRKIDRIGRIGYWERQNFGEFHCSHFTFFQHWELEEANCIKAIAPVHCFSAFWSARIKLVLLGLSGVDVFLGWNTLGDAIITLGRFMLAMSCSLLLVRASRSQRRLGFSGRTGVSGSAKKPLEPLAVSFMTFSRLESNVLLRWHSWSKDS